LFELETETFNQKKHYVFGNKTLHLSILKKRMK